MHSALRPLLFSLLWAVLSLILALVGTDSLVLRRLPPVFKVSYFITLLAAPIFEISLLFALIKASQTISSLKSSPIFKLLSGLLLALFGILSLTYTSLYIISSGLNITYHRFLNLNSLSLAISNIPLFFRHLTFIETMLGIIVLIIASILSYLIFKAASNVSRVGAKKECLIFVFSGLALAISILAPFSANYETLMQYRLIKYSHATPGSSLFWAPLSDLLPFNTSNFTFTDLEPRVSLADYAEESKAVVNKKNVLLIVIEALRSDIIGAQFQGRAITPTLNSLQDNSLFFPEVYAQSNESAYSWTSILTGLYPLKYLLRDDFNEREFPHIRIYDVLKAIGYDTALFSSADETWMKMNQVSQTPALDISIDARTFNQSGIRKYQQILSNTAPRKLLKTGKLDDKDTTAILLDWLASRTKQKTETPFFATVSYQNSHFPYHQGSIGDNPFEPHTLSTKDWASISFLGYPKHLKAIMKNRYLNSLNFIDSQVAQILNALNASPLGQNTIVIITGDHGELFGEHGEFAHGFQLFQEAIKVPLFISGFSSDNLEALQLSKSNKKMLIDIAPTILSLLDLPRFAQFQGESIVCLVNTVNCKTADFESNKARPVFSSVQLLKDQDAVIVNNWKYMSRPFDLEGSLYNLEQDPVEQNNLIRAHPDIATCLRETLSQYRLKQLEYYRQATLRSSHFPPRYNQISSSCNLIENDK